MKTTLSSRGWILREAETFPDQDLSPSDPIYVRGARKEDHPEDYKHGFVYAETEVEAEEYDRTYFYS